MTRRVLAGILLPYSLSQVRCFGQSQRMRRELDRLDETEDLAILEADRAAMLGEPVTAYRMVGEATGPFRYGDLSATLSVSPDANWVAWVPQSSLGYPFDGLTSTLSSEREPRPLVLVTDGIKPVRMIRSQGAFTTLLSVSSNATRVALVSVQYGGLNRRLVVLDLTKNDSEQDLTSIVASVDFTKVERLKVAGNGQRLVVGTSETFSVLDLPSRKVLMTGAGRFPVLSPLGDSVAFVDGQGRLIVGSAAAGAGQPLLKGLTVDGLGAFSPDGKFLLAGIRRLPFMERVLIVLDSATGEFVEVMKLGDWFGDRFVWISKRFFRS